MRYLSRPECEPKSAERAKGVEDRRPSKIVDKQRGECEASDRAEVHAAVYKSERSTPFIDGYPLGENVVHCGHGDPLTDAHESAYEKERRQAEVGCEGSESSGDRPPDDAECEHGLSADGVSPDATSDLWQRMNIRGRGKLGMRR